MSIKRVSLKAIKELGQGQTVWDDAVTGFGVRRQRRAAVYVFKYRDKSGRQRFLTIGRHGESWTPETARNEAKQYQAMLVGRRNHQDLGNDFPTSAPTLEEFSKLYVERYAALHKKPRSVAEDRRNLDTHILLQLGARKLTEISSADIAEFLATRKGWPANANRCLALISHIFTIAAKWNAVPTGTNPCRGVKRFREQPRERFLTQEELGRLGKTLDDVGGRTDGNAKLAEDGSEDWRAVDALKLLVYTGARLTEILSLQWAWINWDVGFARLPDSKTGSKTLPLPAPALAILHQLSEQHGQAKKHVFPGRQSGTHFTGIQKPWQRIRKSAGLPDVRIHDLRHCYASIAVAGGESLFVVGAVLGHRAPSTTQRYAHLAMAPIVESANRTAARLAALMNSGRHDRGRS